MKYLLSVFGGLLFFVIINGNLTAQQKYTGNHDYFREVEKDIHSIPFDVQVGYMENELIFHSYYGVKNEERVNRRTYGQLKDFDNRTNLYEKLINEIASQNELSSIYLVIERINKLSIQTLEEKKEALRLLSPMLVTSAELYPILEESLDLGYDAPIGASISVLDAGLKGLSQTRDLPHLKDAAEALDGMGFALDIASIADQTKQLAVTFTIFMALDLEVYRTRLEQLNKIVDTEDPAFWSALHNVSSRLERIDTSHWAKIYQFGIDNAENFGSLAFEAGMLSLKIKFGTAASHYLPWASAFYFMYNQYSMVQGHWESLAYGTLAGTLFRDIYNKDFDMQSYLGYIYLRERNSAFRNWTTSLFSFLNFRSWDAVLSEFERGYNEYRYDWMKVLTEQLIDSEPQIIVERERELSICDRWTVANSGGVEGTLDRWDISDLPEGALLDIRFDTRDIPDKIYMEYPAGSTQLNTGWRGSQSYAGPSYPGGVVGPGQGKKLGVFRKDNINHFVVKVLGVDDDTYWEYSVRCRDSSTNTALFDNSKSE